MAYSGVAARECRAGSLVGGPWWGIWPVFLCDCSLWLITAECICMNLGRNRVLMYLKWRMTCMNAYFCISFSSDIFAVIDQR